jgi:phosphoglycolate phosphatase-like HAD superfamily hydrolase
MFSGFIFDVEGTLIDCIPQTLKSRQEALERFGYSVPHSSLQLYSGLDGEQMLRLLVPDADEPARKEILQTQGTIYEKKYLDGVQPYDGVRDVFQSLVQQGGRIALATDCKGPELKHYLSLLDVHELISAIACGDDVQHGKPDPRLIGLALPGSQAVMIGDTPYDAEAAIEAGASAACVLTGGFSSKALLEAGCFAVANDLRALLPSLKRGAGCDDQPSNE